VAIVDNMNQSGDYTIPETDSPPVIQNYNNLSRTDFISVMRDKYSDTDAWTLDDLKDTLTIDYGFRIDPKSNRKQLEKLIIDQRIKDYDEDHNITLDSETEARKKLGEYKKQQLVKIFEYYTEETERQKMTKPQLVDRIIEVMKRSNDFTIHSESSGHGLKHKKKIIKHGGGIEPQPDIKFMQFGKYYLHYPKLQENQFNLRYQSGANHNKFPVIKISKDYKEFLNDFIRDKKINEKHLKTLSKDEQLHFKNLIRESGLSNYKVSTNHEEDEKNELNRFEILRGEVAAGNNNPKIIAEFRELIQKFMNSGKLLKREAQQALNEIKGY
jgi:hypothetical protein